MPHITVNAWLLINSYISEGPVYASFNLGQCLNVALLDLVATAVSGCLQVVIFKLHQIFKKTNEIKKKCKLMFIKFYYSFDFLKAS